jgi:hypothetical protein
MSTWLLYVAKIQYEKCMEHRSSKIIRYNNSVAMRSPMGSVETLFFPSQIYNLLYSGVISKCVVG